MAPRHPEAAAAAASTPMTPQLHPEEFLAPLSYVALAVLLVTLYRLGPRLSRLTRLPVITLYMLVTPTANTKPRACRLPSPKRECVTTRPCAVQAGVTAAQIGVLPEATLEQLGPAHSAALGCITFAAGSELVIEQLRANKKLVGWLALSMCGCSFAIVFVLMMTLLTAFPASTGASDDLRHAHAPDNAPASRLTRHAPRALRSRHRPRPRGCARASAGSTWWSRCSRRSSPSRARPRRPSLW